ncbi:MAG TPA: hypothetical protein VGN81_10860 [Pseudonocardiaceae bacterium]
MTTRRIVPASAPELMVSGVPADCVIDVIEYLTCNDEHLLPVIHVLTPPMSLVNSSAIFWPTDHDVRPAP